MFAIPFLFGFQQTFAQLKSKCHWLEISDWLHRYAWRTILVTKFAQKPAIIEDKIINENHLNKVFLLTLFGLCLILREAHISCISYRISISVMQLCDRSELLAIDHLGDSRTSRASVVG